MTTMSSSQTLTRSDLDASLQLVEVKPGLRFSLAALKNLLPDVTTALFFGKVYGLDYVQLSNLLKTVLNSELAQVLFAGDHSTELQDYLIDFAYAIPDYEDGSLVFSPDVPKGEILPELWASLEVEVADSIAKVAETLSNVIDKMPGKQGEMVFRTMATLNAKRPTIGDYKAQIHHAPQKQNLVIFDVSGSISAYTVGTIVEDVVALSYKANAHLAIVSDTCTYWEPGTYDVAAVLAAAEYSGTHYEKLKPLFNRDWGVVVCIADYDSSPAAMNALGSCRGRIDEVLDVSLVNQPTFMSRCVGQLAAKVRPLLVASTAHVLTY